MRDILAQIRFIASGRISGELRRYTDEKISHNCEATKSFFVLDIIHTVWIGHGFIGSPAADDLNG